MSLKTKIIAFVVSIGLILIAIFNFGLGVKPTPVTDNQPQDTSGPSLISSNPPELFEKKPLIFRPDQTIELNFNTELENVPETKLAFDPAVDPENIKLDLINEGKTLRITPIKPYELGRGYTISIKSETKIKGGKTLGKDYNMQFNVINYSGV